MIGIAFIYNVKSRKIKGYCLIGVYVWILYVGPDCSPSDMVFIICRKHISRLRVSAWSSLSKREPKPIRDWGLVNYTEHISIMLGMRYCTVIILRIYQQLVSLLTFSHPSIFSLLRSLLLGLDSMLMSEPRESVLLAVDTASDENTERKKKDGWNRCLPAYDLYV